MNKINAIFFLLSFIFLSIGILSAQSCNNSTINNTVNTVEICDWGNCNKAAVSISVDDSFTSCRQELNAKGFKGTYYLLATNNFTQTQWDTFNGIYKEGHELGLHTLTHICNGYNESQLRYEIETNIDDIKTHINNISSSEISSIAWPCGTYSTAMGAIADDYLVSGRSYFVNELEDKNPADFMNLKSFNTPHYNEPQYEPPSYISVVDSAESQGKWANLIFHNECTDDGSINYLSTKNNIWVAPVGFVAKYIKERQNTSITNIVKINNTLTFKLINGQNHNLFNKEITLRVSASANSVEYLKINNVVKTFTYKDGYVLFNLVPSGNDNIEIKFLTNITCVTGTETQCSDGIDNDGAGKIDGLVEGGNITNSNLLVLNPKTSGILSSTNVVRGQTIKVTNIKGTWSYWRNGPILNCNTVYTNANLPPNTINASVYYPGGSFMGIFKNSYGTVIAAYHLPYFQNGIIVPNGATKLEFYLPDTVYDDNSGYCSATLNAIALPQCSDGIDNDGDGKIDLADNGCASSKDNSEIMNDNDCKTTQCDSLSQNASITLNSPWNIREFVNSLKLYNFISDSASYSTYLRDDQVSANKVCQLAGFNNGTIVSTDYFRSCGDNGIAYWDTTKNNFITFNSCYHNSFISKLTCTNPGTTDSYCKHTIAECTRDKDCVKDYKTPLYCNANNVEKDSHNYSCVNHICVDEIKTKVIRECSDTCSNGKCVNNKCNDNNLNTVGICDWSGCKSGAVSISVDDSFTSCRQELNAKGFKGTYYLLATNNMTQTQWDTFNAIYKEGHELGLHTLTHICNGYNESQLRYEIETNIDDIKTHINNISSSEISSIAWPCGTYSTAMGAIADDYLVSGRSYFVNELEDKNPADFMYLKSFNTPHYNEPQYEPPNYMTVVDSAEAEGKWANLIFHGECTDEGAIAYIPTKDVWEAPVGFVAKYIKERQNTQITNVSKSSRVLTFNLTNGQDHNLFNKEITMKVDTLGSSVQYVKVNGNTKQFTLKDNFVLFNLVPGNNDLVKVKFKKTFC